jgi:hypothetical protein
LSSAGDSPSLIRDFAHEAQRDQSIRSAADVARSRLGSCRARQVARAHPAQPRRGLADDRRIRHRRSRDVGHALLDRGSHSLAGLIDEAIAKIKAIDARETPRFRVAPFDAPLYVNVDRDQTIAVISTVLEHARATCAEDGDIDVTVELEAGHAELACDSRRSSRRRTSMRSSTRSARRRPRHDGAAGTRPDRRAAAGRACLDRGRRRGARARSALSFTRGTDPQDDAGASVPQANGRRQRAHGNTAPDDDPARRRQHALRTTYSEALTELGYDVIAANDGRKRSSWPSRASRRRADRHPPADGQRLPGGARSEQGHDQGDPARDAVGHDARRDHAALSLNAGFDDCIDKMAGPSALDALLHAS